MTNVIYNFQSPNSLLERTGVCIQTGFTANIIMPEISMSLKTLRKRWNIFFIKCRNQDGTGEQPELFHFHSARKELINGVVKFVSISKFISIISCCQIITKLISWKYCATICFVQRSNLQILLSWSVAMKNYSNIH